MPGKNPNNPGTASRSVLWVSALRSVSVLAAPPPIETLKPLHVSAGCAEAGGKRAIATTLRAPNDKRCAHEEGQGPAAESGRLENGWESWPLRPAAVLAALADVIAVLVVEAGAPAPFAARISLRRRRRGVIALHVTMAATLVPRGLDDR